MQIELPADAVPHDASWTPILVLVAVLFILGLVAWFVRQRKMRTPSEQMSPKPSRRSAKKGPTVASFSPRTGREVFTLGDRFVALEGYETPVPEKQSASA